MSRVLPAPPRHAPASRLLSHVPAGRPTLMASVAALGLLGYQGGFASARVPGGAGAPLAQTASAAPRSPQAGPPLPQAGPPISTALPR